MDLSSGSQHRVTVVQISPAFPIEESSRSLVVPLSTGDLICLHPLESPSVGPEYHVDLRVVCQGLLVFEI